MSEDKSEETKADPRDAMRQALERKKAAEHENLAGGIRSDVKQGSAHRKAAGKREFRRKSGG